MIFTKVEKKIKAWELPLLAEEKLLRYPDLCKYLLKEKDKFPLPPYYLPKKIKFFFDNKLAYEINTSKDAESYPGQKLLLIKNNQEEELLGRLPSEELILRDLKSVNFVEVKFDDDCALFLIDGYKAIDRLCDLIIINS